jgi:hypothetical protein
MRSRTWFGCTAVLLVAVLLAVLVVGCASRTGQQDAAAVATRFLDAAGRGDTEMACALLTPRTREDLATADGQPCEQSLPTDRLGGSVEQVDAWSDWARVNTADSSVFLTEFNSGWLVSAAGCEPNGDAPYRCVVGG